MSKKNPHASPLNTSMLSCFSGSPYENTHFLRDTQETLAVLDRMDVEREDDPQLREQDTMKKFGWEEDYFQVRQHFVISFYSSFKPDFSERLSWICV